MKHEKKDWLDRPRNVKRLIWTLVAVCALLLVLGLLPMFKDHLHFGFEGWPGFYAVYGFVGFFLLVLTGWPLRKLLGRKDDYYDD